MSHNNHGDENLLCQAMAGGCKVQQAGANLVDNESKNRSSSSHTEEEDNNNLTQDYRHRSSSSDQQSDDGSDGSINGGGRGSSQAESAFSSGQSSDSSCDDDCARSSASGRSSSVNQDSQSLEVEEEDGDSSSSNKLSLDMDQSNLVPDIKEAMELINEIRVRFLESLKEEDLDLYNSSDIDELRKPLPDIGEKEQSLAVRLISRFIDFKPIVCNLKQNDKQVKKDIQSALDSLREFVKFRHHYQLPNTLADQFCQEFYTLDGIFDQGHDKRGLPVLYIRARVHRKWSLALDDSLRRYVAWRIDRLTKSYANAKVAKTIGLEGLEKDGSFAMCFDCLSVSYACLDMDFLRFLVHLFVDYYPSYCRYVWLVDLPWLFRSVWKLVRTWLPDDTRVQLITAKQLTDYINEDQIPNSFKINDLKASEKPQAGKHQRPINFSSIRKIEGLASDLNLNAKEVKQFKTHLETIRKEYEQLGAL